MDLFPDHTVLAAIAIKRVGYFLSDSVGDLTARAPALALMKSTSKFRLKAGPTFLQ